MKIIDKPQTDVIIVDELSPEEAAMLLALYSRDPRSVRVHLEKVAQVGAGKFMGQFYVGYGHKSIGDCGSTTICIENISMLAAKAIQQNPLYNGQEASTRYLDMTQQAVLNPLGTKAGEKIQEVWMSLYARALDLLVPHLIDKYPRLDSDDEKIYLKAIKAKAFDIARAFLPAGCTTYVGWHTNLRQAWDHLKEMSFHPLSEVRELTAGVLTELKEKYPNSFNFKSYEKQDQYLGDCAGLTYENLRMDWDELFSFKHTVDVERLGFESDSKRLLKKRPEKTELPETFDRYGQIQFRFLLDFGSFRDLQRHRSCTQVMPLLTTKNGFHEWYIGSLPVELRTHVLEVMAAQKGEIDKIENPTVRQYYIAMGYNVACELTAGLPSAVYIAELRSGQTVHPTLRPIAQQMGAALKSILPEMAIHCDNSPDEWSVARGKHDIVKK